MTSRVTGSQEWHQHKVALRLAGAATLGSRQSPQLSTGIWESRLFVVAWSPFFFIFARKCAPSRFPSWVVCLGSRCRLEASLSGWTRMADSVSCLPKISLSPESKVVDGLHSGVEACSELDFVPGRHCSRTGRRSYHRLYGRTANALEYCWNTEHFVLCDVNSQSQPAF
jgi:hypothetical protein